MNKASKKAKRHSLNSLFDFMQNYAIDRSGQNFNQEIEKSVSRNPTFIT
jgi:hypothetical protein